MASYFVETPHTEAECMQAMDTINAQKDDLLKRMWFSCGTGKHSGYAFLEGKDENDVMNKIPSMLRTKARLTKVERYTADDIRKWHEQKEGRHPQAK